jgi:MoaA/NifB/PqqE/SkfB family radical SAM enzyme
MYKLEEITQVHLEVTENCQAACPMCLRNINNGNEINPHLHMAELSLVDCKKIFTSNFLNQLRSIYMCGNFGDPLVAKDTLEIFQYFREQNPNLWLDMHTHGGARNSEWWAKLATTIGKKGKVIFGVDGLKDTNHIYRQNINWDIVENSMRSYAGAGGIAEWHFLVFKHNEHQLVEAEKMSNEMGIKFVIKKTSRFIHSPVGNRDGINVRNNGNIVSFIEKPSLQYQNSESTNRYNILQAFGNMESFYDATAITCKALPGRLYISAEGLVFPCCWTAASMYRGWLKNPAEDQIWNFIEAAGGKEKLDGRNGINAVFETGIFSTIGQSWSKSSCNDGKLKVCSINCASTFNPHEAQYK